MARLRADNVGDPTGAINPISIGVDGSVSWVSPPANMPPVSAPDTLAISTQPSTPSEQIITLTAYSPGQSTATCETVQETGHPLSAVSLKGWVHGPTAKDFEEGFVFTQAVPATSATVTHNLGRFPPVTTTTLSGEVIIGNVDYIDSNTLTISFSAPFSWIAYIG